MSNTEGTWTQDTPIPDVEIFVGASEFTAVSGGAVAGSAGPGLFSLNLAASSTNTLFACITSIFKRTGLGLPADARGSSGVPPISASQMPTLGKGISPTNRPPAKGMYVSSIDVIYTVAGAALSAATINLTDTTFVNNTAPAVVNRIPLGANGLLLPVQALPYKISVPVPLAQQNFSVNSGTETVLNINMTTGTGTCTFYGAVLHCMTNLN